MSQQDIIRHQSRGNGSAQPQPTADDIWMQHQQLAIANQGNGLAHGGGGGHGGNGDVQPLQMVHRSLRGRYKLAVLLAAAGAMVGTAVGWSAFEKTYRAKGIVRIDPDIKTPLGQGAAQIEYTRYMGSQTTFIKSPDIVGAALKRKEWTDVAGTNWDVAAFMARLTTLYSSSAYDINVTFDHPNRDLAQAAVKATLAAYADYRDQQMTTNSEFSTSYWQQKKDALVRQVQDAKKQLVEVQKTEAAGDLNESLRLNTTRLETRAALLEDQRFILAQMLGRREAASKNPELMSEAQLALKDPLYARLFTERDALRVEYSRNQRSLGPNNPTVLKIRDQMDAFDQQIAQIITANSKGYYGTVKSLDPTEAAIPVTDREIDIRTADAAALQIVVDGMKKSLAAASDVRATMATLNNDISSYQDQLKNIDDRLADATAKAATVTAQYRTIPSPLVDIAEDKRPTMATFGFVAGGAIPLMGLVLWGLFDRKYRYSDETMQGGSTKGVPLLGILPNLPDRLSDPSQASVAAHCVHQIRTMLQLNVLGEGPAVLSVSSATSGDGKTSLSLALGLSFAASGSRTLLIDTDLIGAGLSARLNIREAAGIGEAVASRDPMSFVRETDVADLSVLPVGMEGTQNASAFSPSAVRRLVNTVRQHFDIVLIDTGPVLGSIEAPAVVAASDAVILTVARGQNRDLVEKAIGLLRSFGARIAGVVFNRANAKDFERSISGISLRSVSRASSMNGNYQSNNGERQDKRLGPLVHSVRGTKDEN